MKLRKFGLGIRFDFLSIVPDDDIQRNVFEELFSVLTLSDVAGYSVYGGMDPTAPEGENIYLAVILGGKLKDMRRVYGKIAGDAAIGMYLAYPQPFIENNRLEHIEGLSYFGDIGKDGYLTGGETAWDIRVPKKHGKRRPVGKGIRILMASPSTEVIKRLTLAARRHFPGAKIMPVPIASGGAGTVRAMVTGAGGAFRSAEVSRGGVTARAEYGVLHGRTGVIEAAGLESSFELGELIRRALDEGLKQVLLGLEGFQPEDGYMGCMRALGAKFYDPEDNELFAPEDLPRVCRADTELLHPAVAEARFTVISGSARLDHLSLLSPACAPPLGAVLDALEFEKLLSGVALVVTGGGDETSRAIQERCAAKSVPVAVLPEGLDVDETADVMFRLIRIGRDVEKIGAPNKEPKRQRLARMIRR